MTWSLRISNGDFAVKGAQLSTVSGTQKLVQDLRCAILEKMGTDNLHPGFGSLIDGGVRPDGSQVPSIIGVSNFALATAAIEADIRRIANAYQKAQAERIKTERLVYNKVTLTASEILAGISSIQTVQDQDALYVRLTLLVGNGTEVDLTVPVANEPLVTT